MVQIFFPFSDLAILLLRLVLGAILITHGFKKIKNINSTASDFAGLGLHPATFFAFIAIFIEFFGGIFLTLGFLTQIVSLLVALQFLLILFKVEKFKKFVGGYEYPILIFAVALVLMTIGGGEYSVDSFFSFLVY